MEDVIGEIEVGECITIYRNHVSGDFLKKQFGGYLVGYLANPNKFSQPPIKVLKEASKSYLKNFILDDIVELECKIRHITRQGGSAPLDRKIALEESLKLQRSCFKVMQKAFSNLAAPE
jgi:hypothetical protein